MPNYKLFMVLLGCRPHARLTEQHDVFFGIAKSLADLLPDMNLFWPDSGGLHIDAWREITHVDGHSVVVKLTDKDATSQNKYQLYFINLGGYKHETFDELHCKIIVVAQNKAEAIKKAKQTSFYKSAGIKSAGGASHIDDKFGIDIDQIVKINDIVQSHYLKQFEINIQKSELTAEDELHIGYLKFNKLQ